LNVSITYEYYKLSRRLSREACESTRLDCRYRKPCGKEAWIWQWRRQAANKGNFIADEGVRGLVCDMQMCLLFHYLFRSLIFDGQVIVPALWW